MIDDETLMAYVDGELDAEGRAVVDQAAAASPEVAARLAAHQGLRARLAEVFAGSLAEPVPEPLIRLIADAAPPSAEILDLAAARARRRARVSAAAPIGGLMAASLALGLVIGGGVTALGPKPPIVARDGALIAQGGLSRALDRQLAATQDPRGAIRIGLSVRARDGRYCRTFIDAPARTAGLACRGDGAWVVHVAAAAAYLGGEGTYRTAADDTPAAVLDAAQAIAAGPPLDSRGEAAGLAARWSAAQRPPGASVR